VDIIQCVSLFSYNWSIIGTEAVMGVPGHDDRDHQFAIEHGIKISTVAEDGVLVNSEKVI